MNRSRRDERERRNLRLLRFFFSHHKTSEEKNQGISFVQKKEKAMIE